MCRHLGARVGTDGLQVDVRALSPDSFGAAMQYFTGSKDQVPT